MPLLIAGFHRSGTSALSYSLQRLGWDAGSDLLPAHLSNPDGHFEDWWMVNINNALLAHNQTTWQCTLPLHVTAGIEEAMGVYLAHRAASPRPWVAKDPRTGLAAQAWFRAARRVLPAQPAVVVPVRHAATAAASLRNRHAFAIASGQLQLGQNFHLRFWQEPSLPFAMWLAHHASLQQAMHTGGNRFDVFEAGRFQARPAQVLADMGLVAPAATNAVADTQRPVRQAQPSWLGADAALAARVKADVVQLCGVCDFERLDFVPTAPNPPGHAKLLAQLHATAASLPFVGTDAPAPKPVNSPANPVRAQVTQVATLDQRLALGDWAGVAQTLALPSEGQGAYFQLLRIKLTCALMLGHFDQVAVGVQAWWHMANGQDLPARQWERMGMLVRRLDRSALLVEHEALLQQNRHPDRPAWQLAWARWLLSRQRPAELDALFGHWQQATPECAASVPKPLRPVVSEWALLRGNRTLALRLQAQTLLESFTPASYQHYINTTLAQLPSLESQTDLMARWLASLRELFFMNDLGL